METFIPSLGGEHETKIQKTVSFRTMREYIKYRVKFLYDLHWLDKVLRKEEKEEHTMK